MRWQWHRRASKPRVQPELARLHGEREEDRRATHSKATGATSHESLTPSLLPSKLLCLLAKLFRSLDIIVQWWGLTYFYSSHVVINLELQQMFITCLFCFIELFYTSCHNIIFWSYRFFFFFDRLPLSLLKCKKLEHRSAVANPSLSWGSEYRILKQLT